MEDALFWRLAARYLAGEASEQEVETLQACMTSEPARRAQFDEAARVLEQAGHGSEVLAVDVPAAWDRLERRIAREERGAATGTGGGSRIDRPAGRSRHRIRPRLPHLAGGVALLLAAVLAVLFWPEPSSPVLVAERGERRTARLVDGTRVELNAGSRLTLLAVSDRGRREVYLDGEAFFEVTPDATRPFTVRTQEGVIRVVGTAFNVEAYAGDEQAGVAVAEGAVALEVNGDAPAVREDTVVLRPGQYGILADRRLRALDREADLEALLAWREGRLVFEDASFPEVVRRLERWYDLQIEGASLESVDRLNAEFDRETAAEVVGDVATALGLAYELNDRRVRFYRPSATAPSRPPLRASRPLYPRT